MDDDFTEQQANRATSVRHRRKLKQEQKAQKIPFKVRLFKIYYHLTKERNTGLYVACLLMLLMFIQLCDLLISPLLNLPFKGALYNEVSTIFDTIRIYPAVISSNSAQAYWFFMYSFLFAIIIYLLQLIYMDFSIKIKKLYVQFPISVLQFMSTAFFWLLVIPITDFFISIYECNSDGSHIMDASLQCWTGTHAFLCTLFSLGLIVFLAEVCIISLFYNESRPYYTDALTRLDTNQEIHLTIHRVILTVVSHYTYDQQLHWVILTLHFFMSVHVIKSYMKFLPYYFTVISTLYGAICIGYLWISVNSLLVKALESIEYRGQIIVILIGFLFIYPVAYYIRQNKIYDILMQRSQEKITNDLELDQFVTNFQNLLQEQQNKEELEMMLLGFLYLHREECTSLTCPLKNNDELYLPLTDSISSRAAFPSKDNILHQHLVNSVYLDYEKQHLNTLTTVEHTSYAFFLAHQMGNIHSALIELNQALKCHNTIQQGFTIFKTKQLIEEHIIKNTKLSKNNQNSTSTSYAELDVTIVITFETLYRRLEKSIEQSASDHIEFWSHLDSNMIDLNVINKLGLNIINSSKKASDIWNQLIKINPNYPNALYIYGNYLHSVKNDYETGDEYKNQYHQVKRNRSLDDFENQFDMMFAEDTTVIVISGSKEHQGKIIKTNQGIFKLFGYSMLEVLGHDVNILMPPVIAIKHHYFLEKFFRTGKQKIINGQLDSFAMYRTGTIFAINLVVKPVPSLKNDIQYIGMIKKANKDYEYIVTDENGKIDSISEGVTSLFKLPISFFKEHEIPIQVIVPELCEVSRFKGYNGEPLTNFEAFNDVKDLRFMIPKNFSSSTSRGGGGGHTSTGVRGIDTTTEDNNSATGTGTGTGTQTSSSSKMKNQLQPGLIPPTAQQTFVGLRSPESLKSISNMFKNSEHKGNPDKYKNNLLNHVNYSNPDFDKVMKTDIQTNEYSDGELKIKVFKIFFSKRKKNQLGKDSSTTSSVPGVKDQETMLHQFGMTGMNALNDQYAFQKYKELIQQSKNLDKNFNYKRIQHDINVLKVLLERQRKVRTYGNIITPEEYEQAELERMILNIQALESQIIEIHSESNKSGQGNTDQSSGVKNQNHSSILNQQKDEDDSNTLQKAVPSQQTGIQSSNNNERFNNSNQEQNQKSQSHSPAFNDSGDNKHYQSRPNVDNIADDEYDNDLDEDTKSANLIKSRKKEKSKSKSKSKNKNKDDSTMQRTGEETGTGTKNGKKVKENPRQEFVNDFFMQNLQNQNQPSSSRQKSPYQAKATSPTKFRPNYQLQNNDILRNLHGKKMNERNKDHSSSYELGLKKDENDQNKEDAEGEGKDEGGDSASVKMAVEDTGSVASDTKILMRQLRVLRNSLYEQYSPQSVQNLKHSARFIMIVIIAMTISSYIISMQKYDQLKENFFNIQSSQERMQSLTTINFSTRVSTLIQQGIMERKRYGPGQDYFQKMTEDLYTRANIIQQAQRDLSNTKFDFSDDNKYIINAKHVTVIHNTPSSIDQQQIVNSWSAITQIVIRALQLSTYNVDKFVEEDSSIWFILQNSMNNILEAIYDSTDGILDDTKILSQSNKKILMILLLIVSGCLLASVFIIMPVVTKVHKDKDKLLSLFLLIDQNDVREQLKKCKDFFTTFHSEEKLIQNADQGFDFDDEEKKEGEEQENNKNADGKTPSSEEQKKEGAQTEQKPQPKKFSRKNKKLKKYSTNYIGLILKFFVVISVLESYFLYQYFQSDNFLNRSIAMINEASTIASRSFSNYLLYQIIFEMLATNGKAKVFNQQSTEFIVSYLNEFNTDLESFLNVHSDNTPNHDEEFNQFFDDLIYRSVCESVNQQFSDQAREECSSYLGGILEKGLYSANLAFWDNMREIRNSYFNSDKSEEFISNTINSNRLIENERLNEIYFSKAYEALMSRLNESINIQFEDRNKEITILFATYLVLVILLYFILWGKFVESMRHSLWVTKSMLAIVPLEVIEKVKVIKDFLFATSQSTMSSIKE